MTYFPTFSTFDKVIFWAVIAMLVAFIFVTGFILGRASVHWGHPTIGWAKEGP